MNVIEQGPKRITTGSVSPERAGGVLLLAGAALVLVTVILPPAAVHSDAVILVLGAVSGLAGVFLLAGGPNPHEAILGLAAALGTAVITFSTYEAGLAGTGADDNSILYLWICLYAFYFLRFWHAIAQLAVVAAAYGALLLAEAPPETILTRWLTTMVTLLVAGLLVARLRFSLEGSVEELTRRARIDSLTGLLNRRALAERAAVEFARARRNHTPTSVLQIDVDRFKALNDNFGHPVGDDVLQRIAIALSEVTRPTDDVARVGGDEFMVLLPDTSATEANSIAERLRAAAEYDLNLAGIHAPLSVGAATTDGPPSMSFDALWAAADAAMYEAKRAGGDRVRMAGAVVPAY